MLLVSSVQNYLVFTGTCNTSPSNFLSPHITYFSICCCTKIFVVTSGWAEPVGSSLNVGTRLNPSLIYGKDFSFPQVVVMCQSSNLEEVYFWQNSEVWSRWFSFIEYFRGTVLNSRKGRKKCYCLVVQNINKGPKGNIFNFLSKLRNVHEGNSSLFLLLWTFRFRCLWVLGCFFFFFRFRCLWVLVFFCCCCWFFLCFVLFFLCSIKTWQCKQAKNQLP